ncbi:MAG: GNAT family N-acetyltransferase [Methanobrevibacter sp.]|jgi:GNAT superfamily N-acetyltransferase|nr:GNAT family N-acetyltransferase [Candidatus Methanoflexus mossambicus]
MDQIDFNNIKIKLLTENNVINQFDCGNTDLNEFLQKDAIIQKNFMLNTSYLVYYDDKIVGFFTLSTDIINLKKLSDSYKEKFEGKEIKYKTFPAIKLGRLAIDKEFQQKGIGELLIQWIINYSLSISKNIGFRFISIDAYITAYKFYQKHYFQIVPKNLKQILEKFEKSKTRDKKAAEKMTIPMFLDLYKFKSLLS